MADWQRVAALDDVWGDTVTPARAGAVALVLVRSGEGTADVVLGSLATAPRPLSAVLHPPAVGGNGADASRRLKTDRANLYRRMRRLNIPVNDE